MKMEKEDMLKKRLEAVNENLDIIIQKRQYRINQIKEHFEMVENLFCIMDTIMKCVRNMHEPLLNEEKEICDIKFKHFQIQKLRLIDAEDYYNNILLIEADSIIMNSDNVMKTDSLAEKTKELKKYIGTVFSFFQELVKAGLLEENEESKGELAPETMKKTNKKEITEFVEKNSQSSLYETTRALGERERQISSPAPELKQCQLCNKLKRDVLIFPCDCKYCPWCLKFLLESNHSQLLFTTFEAANKQISLCACPTHNSSLSTKILSKIFSHQELEKYSIMALKRQIHCSKLDQISCPNICSDCKKVCDEDSLFPWCFRHKLCDLCLNQRRQLGTFSKDKCYHCSVLSKPKEGLAKKLTKIQPKQ